MTVLMIGLCAGFFSGLLGIGGAVIMVPAMVYVLKVSQHLAQGTALLIIIPTAISGVLVYSKHNHVDVNMAIVITVTAILGGLIGASAAQYIPAVILRKLFGIFMAVVGFQMFFRS
ncbi:MAG: sulfite exporter TauE/SafE family protein [Candidatus Margulisiibacteriota bacterium]